ncbi:hypothetical protein KW791_03455 [Candidatus Parcubacteria bacterium]|nr:hypothetical protein [Candidatus Parcubacteria bacterium]
MANLYTQHDINIRKTWFLMTVFFLLIIGLGWLFSYTQNSPEILYIAVAVSVGMNLFAYWNSDKVALSLSKARPINRDGNEELFRIVENLSITAG